MNTTSKRLGVVQGQANSALADALGNILTSTYITNVTWNSSTHTLSFYSGSTLKYSCVIELDQNKTGYFFEGYGYLYANDNRTNPILWEVYVIKTAVSAIEYFDPKWADQPGYGDGTRVLDASKISLEYYSPSSMNIMPDFGNQSIWNYSKVVIKYAESPRIVKCYPNSSHTVEQFGDNSYSNVRDWEGRLLDYNSGFVMDRIYQSSDDTVGIDPPSGFTFGKDIMYNPPKLTIVNHSGSTIAVYSVAYHLEA